MQCDICGYKPQALSESDAEDELANHMLERHPEATVDKDVILALLALSLEHKLPTSDVIAKYFEMRKALSKALSDRGE